MSYRLIDTNALNGVISNDDYEKVLNAPCIFADLPNGLDGEHYNLQEPILDKISAEIEKMDGKYVIGDYATYGEYSPKYVQLTKVLQIIDKYKAESEGI